MDQQTSLLLHKFRFVFAGVFTLAFLIFISALVTIIGSGTVLAAKPGPAAHAVDPGMSGYPNAVTGALSSAADGARSAMISAGTSLYTGCRSITSLSARSGRSVVHSGVVAVRGVGSGTAAVGRGIGMGVAAAARGVGGGIMFVLRLPGRTATSVSHVHPVSAIIKPDDNKPVPVISSKTSAAILASLNEQQQKEMASLLAAQLTANEGLGGSIIAGDPTHGGYPAKWDNVAQDSLLDSWGMYNRECVSYAAWKVYQTYGHMPYWGGVGNANQWVRDAKNAGIPTGPTPQVHSVAISMRGYYGHAMWVEAVNGDMIYVSQYNYDLHGQYSEMWVKGNYFTYIYFK
jgi:surface antigen